MMATVTLTWRQVAVPPLLMSLFACIEMTRAPSLLLRYGYLAFKTELPAWPGEMWTTMAISIWRWELLTTTGCFETKQALYRLARSGNRPNGAKRPRWPGAITMATAILIWLPGVFIN